jgi:RimJ/RimL family protein N-acetyltransferase
MSYLESSRIRLVKFTKEFVTKEYIEWLNNQEITKFLCTGRIPIDISEITIPSGTNDLRFAIMVKLDSTDKETYIGTVSLGKIDWIARHGEIGYMIGDKNVWGKGIATEVVQVILEYGFKRLNLHKIEAGVVDGNIGSIKALEKNGFKEYGRIPDDYFVEGKYYDTVRFYKLQEW